MFPKAHAAAYVTAAIRVGWYKVYKPIEFYCAYFTARPDDVDVETILMGHDAVKAYIRMIKQKGKEATKKELGRGTATLPWERSTKKRGRDVRGNADGEPEPKERKK